MYDYASGVIAMKSRIECMPAERPPGPPPAGIMTPSPGRNIGAVYGAINKALRRPEPYVHNNAGRIKTGFVDIGTAGYRFFHGLYIGVAVFGGFHDHFFTIQIFIAHDLHDGLVIAGFFQLDHGNILVFVLRNGYL
jgi:hypothetical protein